MNEDSNELSADSERERILLVDDNATNLQVLYKTLEGSGYRLFIAKNGEAALAIVKKAKPALVLLDIMMPGIDGYEVCRQIKADTQTEETAVIFLSALNETEDKVHGLDLGAVDYISKPFQAEEVIARVETHLTVYRLRRSLSQRNRELEKLNQELANANQRMRRDLEAAARVQQALLPPEDLTLPGVAVAWAYRPCEELAGDALHIFQLGKGHIGAYVLDVCGHGVPSALLSVTARRSLALHGDYRSLIAEEIDGVCHPYPPSQVAADLNQLYPMDMETRLYFTLLYGIVDLVNRSFRFVSAGNPGPIRVPREGKAQVFDVPAVPVGLMEDSAYTDTVIPLQKGDRLYLHSDGLHEERNSAGEEFGRRRICAELETARALSLKDSVDQVVSAVIGWRGGEQLRDDIAVVAVELL
ncbi:MAG: SpoIIE family protein phosphatase [Chromatiales bacterium]|nr:SpoIIE family protein phosphatase [Chromatiales bacterium]